jgi:hypothetical protein
MNSGVDLESLSRCCELHLGARLDAVLFETGFTTRVLGVRLRDSREVVLKLWPYANRLLGAGAVHEYFWDAGFPCPQLLVRPMPLGQLWISTEAIVRGGHVLTDDEDAPEVYGARSDPGHRRTLNTHSREWRSRMIDPQMEATADDIRDVLARRAEAERDGDVATVDTLLDPQFVAVVGRGTDGLYDASSPGQRGP